MSKKTAHLVGWVYRCCPHCDNYESTNRDKHVHDSPCDSGGNLDLCGTRASRVWRQDLRLLHGPMPPAEGAIPAELLALLRQVYTDKGCWLWWHSRNRNLGNLLPPCELWEQENRAGVLAEAQRLTGDLNG